MSQKQTDPVTAGAALARCRWDRLTPEQRREQCAPGLAAMKAARERKRAEEQRQAEQRLARLRKRAQRYLPQRPEEESKG